MELVAFLVNVLIASESMLLFGYLVVRIYNFDVVNVEVIYEKVVYIYFRIGVKIKFLVII